MVFFALKIECKYVNKCSRQIIIIQELNVYFVIHLDGNKNLPKHSYLMRN